MTIFSTDIFMGYCSILAVFCAVHFHLISKAGSSFKHALSTAVLDLMHWKPAEYLWLILAPCAIVLINISLGGSALELACSVISTVCVILVAKGRVSSYIWGFFGTFLYMIVSWRFGFYGETLVYALLFVPMQVHGYYLWLKNTEKGCTDVTRRTMNAKQRTLMVTGAFISIALYAFLLRLLEGSAPGLDSATSVLSVIATVLMLLRFSEQWLLWIGVNTIAVIMWVTAVLHHKDQGYAVLAMWIVFLLNSIFGWYQWRKGSKNEST